MAVSPHSAKIKTTWFSKARTQNFIRVRTETLTDVLCRHKAPKFFGLLLIDTEGLDFEVLDGLDFSQFRPTVIVTEEYEWNADKHAAKYSLLIKNGFSLVQKIGANTIWVDRREGYLRTMLKELVKRCAAVKSVDVRVD